MIDETIYQAAKEVRKQFEKGALDTDLLKQLYLAYHDIPDIEIFLERALRIFPALNCGLASVYMQYFLKKGKIIRGFYKNHPHTFLRISSGGIIVDITADQYAGPAVYVGEVGYPWLA